MKAVEMKTVWEFDDGTTATMTRRYRRFRRAGELWFRVETMFLTFFYRVGLIDYLGDDEEEAL